MPGVGRGTGGGVGGGGGTPGQPPYAPGENDRLPWLDVTALERVLKREEGNQRPMLLLVLTGSHAEDCCAANFERAVFRDQKVVELARNFDCYRLMTSAGSDVYKRYDLSDPKKPALIALDAEGGLIHRQQLCVNPPAYLRVLRSAFKLNAKRVELHEKMLAEQRDIRASIDEQHFGTALRAIDKLLGRREFLLGSVAAQIERDRADVERLGQERLARASQLREERSLLAAYELYRSIQAEFKLLDELSTTAGQCARELARDLRELGVPH